MRALILILAVLFATSIEGLSQIGGRVWPDSLAEKANQITLFDRTVFTIIDTDKSIYTRHYKIGILDKFAKSGRIIDLQYSQFSAIKSAQVIVTDRLGNKIKSYGLRDFEDWSNISYDEASDDRSKYLEIVGDDYPYYIEVAFEIEYKSSLHYPIWLPIDNEYHSLLDASLEVVAPSKEFIRYYDKNVETPRSYQSNGQYHVIWQVKNIKAHVRGAFLPSLTDRLPIIFLGPNAFEIDGYKGRMDSWESIGQWQNKINAGRDNLSKEQYDEITTVIGQYTDTEDKIRAVYRYLQENFRYVSIQLGIGGWQPFETAFVNNNKYGDCKALSFYTKNILQHLDIPAYYTLIKAGSNEFDIPKDFPTTWFNHVIVTVPLAEDTLFLECTSQTNPFGYLGTFTSDRNALMVTESGGQLIRTKVYSEKESLQATKAMVNLNENGDAKLGVKRTYHCLTIPEDFENMTLTNSTKEKQWLYDHLDWGNLSINDYTIQPMSYERLPKAGFELDADIIKMAKKTGNRLFYNPFTFSNINVIQLPETKRQEPIEVKYAFSQVDTITLQIPAGFQLEGKYDDVQLENKYGHYHRQVIVAENGMQLIRYFALYRGRYDNSEYESFRTFIKSVQKSDKQNMVLVRIQ
ncbi:MAG: DUF3858 domain-containing protein [Chitinophagales bacterium]